MDTIQVIVLAIVQGITEFLPISSSAHLILTSQFFGWEDQGVAFDLALHFGTLAAVLLYFRKDVTALTRDGTLSLIKRKHIGQSRLAWLIVYATIPALIGGYFLMDAIDGYLRSPTIIVVTTIVYALLLWAADVWGKKQAPLEKIGLKHAIYIGIAQALALIPGTSRSGSTITAALALGYTREAASRFSFLLAIPITAASIAVKITDDALSADIPWGDFLLGAVLSFVTAILAIHYFLKLLNRFGMMPYVWYRLALAVVIMAVLL